MGTNYFANQHQLEPYYAAAYAQYRLEYLFRKGTLDTKLKPARYQLLMAARLILAPEEPPAMTANKMKKYCESITAGLWDDSMCERVFEQAASVVTKAAVNGITRDEASTAGFTQRVREEAAKVKPKAKKTSAKKTSAKKKAKKTSAKSKAKKTRK